jgi:hypothetical protein
MTASNNFNEQIREYCQQAMNCAREADARNDPKVKRQFLELTRLWLSLAQHCESIKPDLLPARRFPPPLTERCIHATDHDNRQ